MIQDNLSQEQMRNLVNVISTHQKGCTFATLLYTAKGTGEQAKHRLRLGVNFTEMYRKDVELLDSLIPGYAVGSKQYLAARAIRDSLNESLTVGLGNNSRYTLRGHVFETPAFPGIKIMFPQDAPDPKIAGLYITAVSDGKEIIVPGVYKHVNHSPMTVAKNEIRKMLRSHHLRTFHLSLVSRAAMWGETLEIEGA